VKPRVQPNIVDVEKVTLMQVKWRSPTPPAPVIVRPRLGMIETNELALTQHLAAVHCKNMVFPQLRGARAATMITARTAFFLRIGETLWGGMIRTREMPATGQMKRNDCDVDRCPQGN